MNWFLDWPYWNVVAAISTGVLAMTIFIAIYQMRQTRRSTNAQLAIEIFRELRNEDMLNKYRMIYELTTEEIAQLDEDTKKQIEIDYVLDRLDTLGALVEENIIDKKLAMEAYAGASTLRCWFQLAPYIRKLQAKRRFYANCYEVFAYRTYKHFRKERIAVGFHNEKANVKIGNLIEEFSKKEYSELRPRSSRDIKKARKSPMNTPSV